MKKYTGQEWVFFRNRAGCVQFNSVCRNCRNRCKRSFRAELLSCRRYESKKQPSETQENGTVSQGLWKQKSDTRNRGSFSPNRAGEKGEATAWFRVFLCRFKESIPKQEKQTRHHRCRHHGSHFYWLQIQIFNERGIFHECEK